MLLQEEDLCHNLEEVSIFPVQYFVFFSIFVFTRLSPGLSNSNPFCLPITGLSPGFHIKMSFKIKIWKCPLNVFVVMSCPDIRLHFVFLVSDRIRTQTILFNAILMNDKWSITSSKQSTFGHLVVHILRMVSHNGHWMVRLRTRHFFAPPGSDTAAELWRWKQSKN